MDRPHPRRARPVDLPEHLRQEMDRRLSGQLESRDQDQGVGTPVPVREAGQPIPLSPAQERLWVLHQLNPDSAEYNTLQVLRLVGALDQDALDRAFRDLVARHEPLRTRFDHVDGHGVQIITAGDGAAMLVEDLRAVPVEEREGALRQHLEVLAARPFDLRSGQLLRPTLVRLRTDEHVLVLAVHHIITDAWSGGVLLRDLASLYAGHLASADAPDADLPVLHAQYADVAGRRSDAVTRQHLAAWQHQLAGLQPLDLPTDRQRSPVRSGTGAVHVIELDADTTDRLRTLGRVGDATLFMTLVAGVQILLARWTGRDDIAVATAVSGRGPAELEDLVGIFVNTVVLRSQVLEDLPLADFLRSVRATVLAALARQDVPFQDVVDAAGVVREPGRVPLAEVAVNLHTVTTPPDMPGLRVTAEPVPVAGASTDLAFHFSLQDRVLVCHLVYSTDLFAAETIGRLAHQLTVLLSAMPQEPGRELARLPLLPAAELAAITAGGRYDELGPPVRTAAQLLAIQVARRPEALAVVDDTRGVMSYAALGLRVEVLARWLRAAGAGPGSVVAVLLPRSADLVTAILGVLTSGAAYLPVDPDLPAERIRRLLAEAEPTVVLDATELARLDALDPASAPELPGEPVLPSDAAYVIFTSGSTGLPKGVVVTHAGLNALLQAQAERFAIDPRSRVLAFAPVGFDAALAELVVTLFSGATLVVAGKEAIAPGEPLVSLLDRHRVTHLTIPPSALAVLALGSVPPSVTLIVAGEACPPALARTWSARHRMINAYGPTEATVCAAMSDPLTPTVLDPVVPIGRPLAGNGILVLDRRLRPVPVGVPGELYLTGIGLARGYLGPTGRTAERFVAEPYGPAGGRMYRTGDLGRWRPDGVLEYLGRSDDQVKLRGFRIEPAEVEAAIGEHPAVGAAAVAVRTDAVGTRRLVGYLVPSPTGDNAGPGRSAEPSAALPDTAQLRAFLAERLPDHLIPGLVIGLDRLPITANGKLDRAALPDPDPTARPQGSAVAPRTPTEQRLAGIWADLLGRAAVGVQDNFFDLGGDSILGLQVVSRARAAGLPITAKQMLLRQTVADLAAEIDAASTRSLDGPEPSIEEPADLGGEIPATPIQRWFFEELTDSLDTFNQALVLEIAADVDPEALQQALAALVEQHDALRLRAHRVGGSWRLRTATAAESAAHAADLLQTVDLGGRSPAAQDRALAAVSVAAQERFDLADGPLLRARLFRLGGGRAPRLFLTVHHLAVDGVSWRILLGDLEVAYERARAGRPTAPSRPSTTFRRWAERLHQEAESGRFDAERDYWAQVQAAVDQTPSLPRDGSGPNTVATARTVQADLDPSTTDALLSQVPVRYRTRIEDVLLAALARVLASWSGAQQVAVLLESHGRQALFDDLDVSGTLGWFTAHYPVALNDRPGTGWGEALRRAKKTLRAVPGHGIGFGVLRYLPHRPTDAAPASEPEVSLNYLGRFDHDGPRDGLVRGWLDAEDRSRQPQQRRAQLLEVTGLLRDGRLQLRWTYASGVYEQATVETLATAFVSALSEIVQHCADPSAGGFIPSDFPLAGLDQTTLDRLVGSGRTVEDVYPLTSAQAGMLFHSLSAPDRDMYIGRFAVRLDGVDDPAALATAWQRLVDRTPVLRTRVVWQDVARPLQVVETGVRLACQHQDLRALPQDAQDQELERIWGERLDQGLALDAAPLLQVALVRLDDQVGTMFWSIHHLVIDGWSFSELLSDLLEEYAAAATGHAARGVARRPYRDYLAWLDDQDPQAAEEYWRSRMDGLAGPTRLPYDRVPVGAHRGRSSERVRRTLDRATSQQLTTAARKSRITLSTLVRGAWAVLLARHSGESDICLGATVSGRPAGLPGAERIIGLFANTIPVRIQVDDDENLLPWLRRIQEQQLDAQLHEHTALTQIQRWSGVEAGTALFDSIVVIENYPAPADAASRHGVRVGLPRGEEHTNFALTLTAQLDDELLLELGYDPALFDPTTAERLADQVVRLMWAMVAPGASDTAVGRLPLLDPAAESWPLAAAAGVGVAFGNPGCIHDLVDEQAARMPGMVAVSCGEEWLTFAALQARTDRLAAELVARGVGRGDLVAICLERGIDPVVAMLGTLKSGAAFVPLDPADPPARLGEMLDDAAARVVLTRRPLLAALAGRPVLPLCLDDLDLDGPLHPGQEGARPLVASDPRDLAYVIYTSGTTGRPKGVSVEHRQMHHMVRAWDHRHGLAALRPRVLSVSTLSVDLFFSDFLLSCLFGGELAVCPPAAMGDPQALTELVLRHRASLLVTVPALARAISAELSWRRSADPSVEMPLRLLMVGSEGWPVDNAAEVRAALPDRTVVVNAYGSTETTVDSTVFPLERATSAKLGPAAFVPVGRPLANTRIHVLDARLRPVPVNVAGDCYIAGDGVSRGYLHRPGLTAQRFVADPYQAGARMYRTGDRARWRADGQLECLGRADDQVKIRGFRVELGEVEAALAAHPQVLSAAARLWQTGPGPARLAGYIVPVPGTEPDLADVETLAATLLPAAARPATLTRLSTLPVGPAGTVQRRALPPPSGGSSAARPGRLPAAALTSTEQALAAIWAEVLGVLSVDVDQSFFELGGDSVLSIQVVSRIRTVLGVPLSPRQLFDSPTVARLAAVVDGAVTAGAVEAARSAGGPDADPLVGGADRRLPLPLSSAQLRLWFLHNFDPASAEYNVVTALRLHGRLDHAAFEGAIGALVARHEALRTRFDLVDGEPKQLIEPATVPAGVPLETIDATETCWPADEPWDRALELAREQADRPFDLRRGPALRAVLIQAGTDDALLLLVMHHIVTDGWSIRVLAGELSAEYALRRGADGGGGGAAALADPHLGYADYAVWQRRTLERPETENRLEQLSTRLAGLEPLDLPMDRPRPAVREAAGRMYLTAVPVELARGLQAFACRHDATLFMVLVAAVQILLSRYCRTADVAVGTATAGRPREELESLVGLFVNTVVLRAEVDDAASFDAFLDQVRATVLEAFVQEDLPFDRLVDKLRPARDPSRNPLVEVMVGLESAQGTAIRLAGLDVVEVPLVSSAVSHDLSFDFVHHEDGRLQLGIGYATALFDATTIERMAGHLNQLLDGISTPGRSARPVATLSLLSPEEVAELVRVSDSGGPMQAATTGYRPGLGLPGDSARYLLDDRLRPVPIGVPGELYLPVSHLAHGYFGRPGLTASRIVAAPSGLPGDRMYRTGDLVRRGGDGRLKLWSRTDDQVRWADLSGPEPGRTPTTEDPVAYRNPVEEVLAQLWAEQLGLDLVRPQDNFFDLGGDSIATMQVVHRMRQTGLRLTVRDLYLNPTVAGLSALVGTGPASPPQEGVTGGHPDNPAVGEVPLTPTQREFFASGPVLPGHFVQSMLIETRPDPDERALQCALGAVLAHHDGLRTRFSRRADGGWQQSIDPVDPRGAFLAAGGVLRREDLSALPESDRPSAMAEVASATDARLDVTVGQLVRAVLFDCGAGHPAWIHLTVHHLVVDAVSWSILLEDLDSAYRQAVGGQDIRLAEPTTPVRVWSHRLVELVAAGELDEDLEHWSSLPTDRPLPVDNAGPATVAAVRMESFELDPAVTRLLTRRAPGVYRARAHDVLVAALAVALSEWTGHPEVVVDVEGHGREDLFADVDLSRTVGWFTAVHPVALRVPFPATDWSTTVRAVRRQLQAVPRNGFSWSALRWLAAPGSSASRLAERSAPGVVFNYHGGRGRDAIDATDSGGLVSQVHDPIGRPQDDAEPVEHPLEVVGTVSGGRLRVDVYYCDTVFHPSTVEAVARRYRTALLEIATDLADEQPSTSSEVRGGRRG